MFWFSKYYRITIIDSITVNFLNIERNVFINLLLFEKLAVVNMRTVSNACFRIGYIVNVHMRYGYFSIHFCHSAVVYEATTLGQS